MDTALAPEISGPHLPHIQSLALGSRSAAAVPLCSSRMLFLHSASWGGGMVRFFYPSYFHSVVGSQRLFSPKETAFHSGLSYVQSFTGMFCRVLTDRYRRYFTSVSTDRSPQFSSVRPQYPTEISQNVRYSPSTLQRFYRKFGTLPVPYRDFTDSSVLLQYPTEKFCSVRPQHPTEISQIVRYSSSTLQRFHR